MNRSFYTTEEIAERYRTVPGTVRWWRHTGYGPKGVRVGRRVLYPCSEVERFDKEVQEQQFTDEKAPTP